MFIECHGTVRSAGDQAARWARARAAVRRPALEPRAPAVRCCRSRSWLLVVARGRRRGRADAAGDAREAPRSGRRAVAQSVADTPDVVDARAAPRPVRGAAALRRAGARRTGTDFVVVMTPDGIRYTHPDPAQIGRQFLGTIAPAPWTAGRLEDYTGTLGPSVRAVVAGRATAPRVVALVAVGHHASTTVGASCCGRARRPVAARGAASPCCRRRWAPALVAGGSGARRTAWARGELRGCTSTTTPSCTP